jgi:hypothetical protein
MDLQVTLSKNEVAVAPVSFDKRTHIVVFVAIKETVSVTFDEEDVDVTATSAPTADPGLILRYTVGVVPTLAVHETTYLWPTTHVTS